MLRRLLLASGLVIGLTAAAGGAAAGSAGPQAAGGGAAAGSARPQAAAGSGPVATAGVARAASSRLLWATVNVCDSARAPNAMGVRASMPGDGGRGRMYMRFVAQWFSVLRQKWLPVGGKGASRWIYAGRARYESRQAGYTFVFNPPAEGGTFLVRGLVDYQWRARKSMKRRHRGRRRVRAHWAVVGRARRVTRAGVDGVDGGDPPGLSQSSCQIT